MTINLKIPDIRELKPRITVFGTGGAGGNAVNNMIASGLQGCEFVVANTDAQALTMSKAERIVQMGVQVTEGLGAGSQPEVGRAAAEEVIDEIRDHLQGAHMVFVTAGMGGGTGTGAAPVVARCAKELGILTVGVVTKPFHFEGVRRMKVAESGIAELQKVVDTLLIIPNQNLFRVANEKTTFADAFALADEVLRSGVSCITDLMVKEGLINLDFADVRAVMREMGKAMMGTGEASGEKRALAAAEAAISNPLIDDASMKGAKGLLISITGGRDLTLYEVDEAATRIREEVDQEANIIVGATFDENLEGIIRVSVVATGIDHSIELKAPRPVTATAAAPVSSSSAPKSGSTSSPRSCAPTNSAWRSGSNAARPRSSSWRPGCTAPGRRRGGGDRSWAGSGLPRASTEPRMSDRPYTLMSCSVSLDGYLGDRTPRLALSNEADFDRVDEVRASCDAILVGAVTVRTDNPRLLVRSDARREERMARGLPSSPKKITVTSRVDLDARSNFFTAGETEKLVYTPSQRVADARARLGAGGDDRGRRRARTHAPAHRGPG